MAKRPPRPAGGAPEWMVTYGDLMSLLLCFFVLLFSMSSLEAGKMTAAIDSLNSGFGFMGDGLASNIEIVQERIDKLDRGRKKGRGEERIDIPTPKIDERQKGDQSPHGEEVSVQQVPRLELGDDEGYLIQFKYEDDELGLKAKMDLKKIQPVFAGSPYKVIIKGHCNGGEIGNYRQGIDLAYTRAVNVRDYLVSLGMKTSQFQILVVGEYEPLARDHLPAKTNPKEANSIVVVMSSSTPLYQ